MGKRPRYSMMSTNVGLVAGARTPSPRTSPFTKHVLPAPSSPVSATTSLDFKLRPSCSPAASVSSGLRVVIVVSAAMRGPELVERLGQCRDDVSGDEPLLPHSGRRQIAGTAVQVYAG